MPDTSQCLLWDGPLDRKGYAKKSGRLVHRQIYEWEVGPIPPGFQIDHLCHTNDLTCAGGDSCPHRRCVNPDHLEAVTPGENTSRGEPARKPACKNGHLFTPENTYQRKPGCQGGRRQCRACNLEAVRRYQQKRAAA